VAVIQSYEHWETKTREADDSLVENRMSELLWLARSRILERNGITSLDALVCSEGTIGSSSELDDF
jgi:hypothetical protein